MFPFPVEAFSRYGVNLPRYSNELMKPPTRLLYSEDLLVAGIVPTVVVSPTRL
jgi:hypothetical protein